MYYVKNNSNTTGGMGSYIKCKILDEDEDSVVITTNSNGFYNKEIGDFKYAFRVEKEKIVTLEEQNVLSFQ